MLTLAAFGLRLKWWQGAILAVLFAVSLTAAAKLKSGLIIIEPYGGYAQNLTGQQNVEFYNGTASARLDVTYKAALTGLRLSYFVDGLWLGVDGSYYPPHEIVSKTKKGDSWTWNSVSIGEETYKAWRSQLGVNLGYRHRFLIWGSYYPLATMKLTQTSIHEPFVDKDTLRGTGYGGGIGFTLFPHCILNLEYRSYQYKDHGTDASTYSSTGMTYDFKSSEALVTLSFPFEF